MFNFCAYFITPHDFCIFKMVRLLINFSLNKVFASSKERKGINNALGHPKRKLRLI